MSDSSSLQDPLLAARTTPLVALALLEALRSSDAPEEVLEEEDVQQSLPRRLGLSDVVDRQIRRYRELRDRKARMSARELADLLVLVARRPDAEAVFARAGEGLVRGRFRERRLRRSVARVPLPEAVHRHLAFRAARTVARQVNPGAEVRIDRKPAALVVEGSLPAATGVPEACAMVRAGLGVALSLHGLEAGDGGPLHPRCEGRGAERCVWRPDA